MEEKKKQTEPEACKVAKKCGGCQYQGVPYKEQLKKKQKMVNALLSKYGKVEPIIGMENPYYYRNKVHAAFDRDRKGNIVSGTYETKTHRVVPVENCLIEDKMSQEIKGMVQTSLNLGTAYLDADKLVYKYLIRSNTAAGKKLLLERVTTFVKHLSGKVVTMSDYPAWEYKSDSQLRKICVNSFTNVYGHEPEVTSIHAGLECGILAGKMPGVDMISFGPTLESVHTPDECMNVASVERTWEYLLEILKSL